jgi:hypothetical protein
LTHVRLTEPEGPWVYFLAEPKPYEVSIKYIPKLFYSILTLAKAEEFEGDLAKVHRRNMYRQAKLILRTYYFKAKFNPFWQLMVLFTTERTWPYLTFTILMSFTH